MSQHAPESLELQSLSEPAFHACEAEATEIPRHIVYNWYCFHDVNESNRSYKLHTHTHTLNYYICFTIYTYIINVLSRYAQSASLDADGSRAVEKRVYKHIRQIANNKLKTFFVNYRW